jgi:hypothetical protein
MTLVYIEKERADNEISPQRNKKLQEDKKLHDVITKSSAANADETRFRKF